MSLSITHSMRLIGQGSNTFYWASGNTRDWHPEVESNGSKQRFPTCRTWMAYWWAANTSHESKSQVKKVKAPSNEEDSLIELP
ncbi:hypothetical protein AVEN_118236-1 [Araneus ventricosus]|uniref:Uncharacterized protein n=1 Tax=Araneus ventricosus TaxID=182803 RepID=A0A4Y2HVF2_ARAVE|nr:hypothetical protein AVEN_118236-1 [Araneus ventricosus]